jgi:predicted XRE-type DNA-binding protein
VKGRGSEQVDHVKLILIEGIASKIRTQYPTQREAAKELGFSPALVSHLCGGTVSRFSIPFLINLAHKLGARIGVTVE